MSPKTYAVIDFLLAAANVVGATSGRATHPEINWGLAVLLFGTGLVNLVEHFLEGKDG